MKLRQHRVLWLVLALLIPWVSLAVVASAPFIARGLVALAQVMIRDTIVIAGSCPGGSSGNLQINSSGNCGGSNLTGDVTTSGTVATTIAANAVTSAKMAVVNTIKTCSVVIGANNGAVLADADLGPQNSQCQVPMAATVVEVDVDADGGTPSIQVRKRHCAGFTSGTCSSFTTTNLLSGVLAAPSQAEAVACARSATSQTCYDGTTSSGSVTVSTTAIAAGDWLEITSGTAGGVAKRVSVAFHMTVN